MLKYISILLLLFLSLSSIISAQPYAPTAPIPDNPNNDPDIALGIMIMKAIQVPDKSDIDISAYPDAQIIQAAKGESGMLPTVRLVSSDEIKNVVEFYKNELNDWKYEDFYGVHMFWKGEDKMKAMMGQEPVVQVEDGEKYSNLVPGTKTAILIGYSSNK
jgi:hypothetical protein